MSREKLDYAFKLAKDTSGYNAYRWFVDERAATLPPTIKNSIGTVIALCEFVSPASVRLVREGVSNFSLETKTMFVGALVRDITTVIGSSPALSVDYLTDIPGIPATAYLLTKFVANSVVHHEMNNRSRAITK